MDLAFLTEMSNLSPPIIHPPPSYFRTAPPHLAGQFSFGNSRLDRTRFRRFSIRGVLGLADSQVLGLAGSQFGGSRLEQFLPRTVFGLGG